VGWRLGEGGEKRSLRVLEPALLDESHTLAKRGGLGGRLSQDCEEQERQDSSSERTALAIAWPLVPAAQPA
jgi:hypothetical protein